MIILWSRIEGVMGTVGVGGASRPDELFAAMGEFVVRFSGFLTEVQWGVRMMIDPDGLVSFLTAGMRAQQVTDSFMAICPARAGDRWGPADNRMMKAVRRETQVLIEDRNRIAHDIWNTLWLDDGPEVLQKQTTKLSKGRLKVDRSPWTADDGRALCADARRLTAVVAQLWEAAIADPPPSERIVMDDEGHVVVLGGRSDGGPLAQE